MAHVKIYLLLLTLLFSTICFSNDSLTIIIQSTFRDTPVQLDSTKYITDHGDTIQISQVRVYLSNFQLLNETGETYTEPNSYHLVDLEKEASLNIKVNSPIKDISQINFSVGVDSTASVSGAMSGDLDPIFGMYWAWNSGYINAKIEGISSSCKTHNNKFEFHIGGYLNPNQTIQEESLKTEAKTGMITVNMDLNKWFSNTNLSEENSILIPGEKAVEMSKRYKEMFSIATE